MQRQIVSHEHKSNYPKNKLYKNILTPYWDEKLFCSRCSNSVVFVATLGASRLLHLVRNLFCFSSRCHFWKPQTTVPVFSCPALLLFMHADNRQMQPQVFRGHYHAHPSSIFISFSLLQDFSLEPSPSSLLPLFVKAEIMREQHVSSYYTTLCLSKNTQAAP